MVIGNPILLLLSTDDEPTPIAKEPFVLFTQSDLTHTYSQDYGGQFERQSDGHWYGYAGGNTTSSFSPPIPAGYHYLVIDIASGEKTSRWNMSRMQLRTAYGTTGIYAGNLAGTGLKDVIFVNCDGSASGINSQNGVTISSDSQYYLNRQKVIVDISSIEQDMYVGWHKCENWTHIYSIIAYDTLPSTTMSIIYPSGCQCTATNGTTTLIAPDTSGTWSFEIPTIPENLPETWTITATDGETTRTKTKAISVYNFGTTISVDMSSSKYTWTPYSIYSSQGLSSSGWTDDAGVRSMSKNNGSWNVSDGSLVANGDRFSFPVPSSNVLVGFKGKIASGWTPNTNSDWYTASCLFGHELGSEQRDWACLIRRTRNPSIGYSWGSIATGNMTLDADTEYTIFALHTGTQFFIWVDGVLVASVNYTTSGTHLSSMGLFWNADGSSTYVNGTCKKLGVWTFELNDSNADIVLPSF